MEKYEGIEIDREALAKILMNIMYSGHQRWEYLHEDQRQQFEFEAAEIISAMPTWLNDLNQQKGNRMRTIQIITEIEIENDVKPQRVVDWFSAGLDNAEYEELDGYDIDPDKVSIGLSYLK